MDKERSNINFALLSWVRTYKDLNQTSDKKEEFIKYLEKLEEHLKTYNIDNIEVINKSKDYYTISYIKDGQPKVKQFLTTEVEKLIK